MSEHLDLKSLQIVAAVAETGSMLEAFRLLIRGSERGLIPGRVGAAAARRDDLLRDAGLARVTLRCKNWHPVPLTLQF